MEFEIDFNSIFINNDSFLVDVLGAKIVETGSKKYPPFEMLKVEVKDFKHLENMLKLVDEHFQTSSTALVSFDPPTIYIEC
jgi:hypothetical protein